MTKFVQNQKGVVGYLAAFVGIGAVTAVLTLLHIHANSTTVALALLLVVLIVATGFGSRPALLASLLGMWSFNYFFLPPFYTLTISAPENWIAFSAFLITAIIAGQLSSYARRRAEESEIRRGEIERLYSELQEAFEKASHAEAFRQSEQLKSALLEAVTHDLKTPLTSIKASITTLIEDASRDGIDCENAIALDNDARAEFLDIINEETDRLNDFIGGMADMARAEAGRFGERKTRVDVGDLLRDAGERARGNTAGHHLVLDHAPSLSAVKMDAASVGEVLYTLIDNAAKYSPGASEILVSATLVDDGMLQISVDDAGWGIAPELREKVFEKFYRGPKIGNNSRAGGLGLGLAIARGIVGSQGGRIWIEDGQGGYVTRVAFQIPVESDIDAT